MAVMCRLGKAVAIAEGDELIAVAGEDERELLRLARDGGRNAGSVERAAHEVGKEIKLRWLAGRQQGLLNEPTVTGCPSDHCSSALWVAYRVRVRQDRGLGAESAAARIYNRMVKAEEVLEKLTGLRNALLLLERGMQLAWPGFPDVVGDAAPRQEWAWDVAGLTELLTDTIDSLAVGVLREIWLPCDVEDGGLEHLGWLPTGGPGPGGRVSRGGR